MRKQALRATGLKVAIGCIVVLVAGAVTAARAVGASSFARGWAIPADSSALPASRRLHVVLALGWRHHAELSNMIADQRQVGNPSWHRWLTPAEFDEQFAPTAATTGSVVDWLQSFGFQQVRVSADRLLVSADAPAPVIEAAFTTRLVEFALGDRRVFANQLPVTVPARLAGLVTAVLGLQDVVRMQGFMRVRAVTSIATPSAAGGAIQALIPPQFRAAYDVPTDGPAPAVAIFMAGDLGQVARDFQQAQGQFHMQALTPEIVKTGASGASYSSADPAEWDLDSQAVLGIAGSLSRMVWYDMPSLADQDVTQALDDWVNDPSAPTAASASFGLCERSAQQDGSLGADDTILEKAAAEGRTLFVSSGDEGDQCAASLLGTSVVLSSPQVNYPASSPWVVAVGGTTLYTDSAFHWMGETAWSTTPLSQAGSGGGVSAIEIQPAWQSGKVPSSVCGTSRCVPDMAMDANPQSGTQLIVDGTTGGNVYGGTSLAAPLAMAAWARITAATGEGFADPAIYGQTSGLSMPAAGFHDITSGTNGSYSAGTGWDAVTGLGSLDVAMLAARFGTKPPAGGQPVNPPPPVNPPTGGSSTTNPPAGNPPPDSSSPTVAPPTPPATSRGPSGGGVLDPWTLLLLAGFWRGRQPARTPHKARI